MHLRVDTTTVTTPVNTGGAWNAVTGPTVPLAAGLNTFRLSPTGQGGWNLNFLTLTRL